MVLIKIQVTHVLLFLASLLPFDSDGPLRSNTLEHGSRSYANTTSNGLPPLLSEGGLWELIQIHV